MSLRFEWGRRKSESNLRKHGVSFTKACSAFADPLSLTVHDPEHSEAEHRFALVGMSAAGRLLVVVHVEAGDNVRLISARLATSRERRVYEEG